MQKLIFHIRQKRFRYALLLLGILLASWNGYQLIEQPLWSYHALGWEIGMYMIILGLMWYRWARSDKAIRYMILSTLSGLLLAVSFPMSPMLPLLFVAWVPLLLIVNDKDLRFWSVVGYGFHSFLLWNIITTFWVLNTSFAPGIVANTLNAFLMTTPFMWFYVVRRHTAALQAYVVLAATWITFEYIHLGWEISWPWLNLGNAFASMPNLVQWYEYTGIFGGSVWVWASNLLLLGCLLSWWDWKKGLRNLGILLVVPALISVFILTTYQFEGENLDVAIVQPNYEPHYEKFTVPRSEQVAKMVELGLDAVDENVDFLLYPETVLNRVFLNRINKNYGIQKFGGIIDLHPELNIVSGIASYRMYPRDSLFSAATRAFVDDQGDTTYWDIQNSAVWLDSSGVREVYFKSKLVPGAEIFPYAEWMPFFTPIVDMLGGTKEGHVIQKEREIFGPVGSEIAPAICYESIYGAYVGQYVRKGAKAIFIMTNDGWWDDTPGHKQHLAFARLRAIEHRRSIARAANTGISCLIDPLGKVTQATPYEEEAVVRGHIKTNDQLTFYSKQGDYLAKMALLIAIISLILFIFKIIVGYKKEKAAF